MHGKSRYATNVIVNRVRYNVISDNAMIMQYLVCVCISVCCTGWLEKSWMDFDEGSLVGSRYRTTMFGMLFLC